MPSWQPDSGVKVDRMSSEQKEFEEWAIECQFCTFKHDDGRYKHDSTSIAFAAWVASRRAMANKDLHDGQ